MEDCINSRRLKVDWCTNRTTCGCCSSLRREISRMAVEGTPSSSPSSFIFFRATSFDVPLISALNTVPYVPSPIFSNRWYLSIASGEEGRVSRSISTLGAKRQNLESAQCRSGAMPHEDYFASAPARHIGTRCERGAARGDMRGERRTSAGLPVKSRNRRRIFKEGALPNIAS